MSDNFHGLARVCGMAVAGILGGFVAYKGSGKQAAASGIALGISSGQFMAFHLANILPAWERVEVIAGIAAGTVAGFVAGRVGNFVAKADPIVL